MAIVRSITADISDPTPFIVSGDFEIYGSGGFGSGTAQLERRNTSGDFEAIIGATYTSAFSDEVTARNAGIYRVVMTGSTTPTLRVEVPGATNFNEPA